MNIDITELEFYNIITDVKIDTPDGYQEVGDFVKKENKHCYRLLFSNSDIIECSEDHLFQKDDGNWISTKDITIGDTFSSKEGIVEVWDKEYKGIENVFDLEVLHDNHRYYSNSIVSHNTGKNYLTLSAACKLMDKYPDKYNKIVYMRKTIASEDKQGELGFLPGSLNEKMAGYNMPVIDTIEKFVIKQHLKDNKKSSLEDLIVDDTMIQQFIKRYNIQFEYMGHMRGRTLNNCILLWDECLHEDEILYTKEGIKTIQEISEILQKDETIEVLSYNFEKDINEYKEVSNIRINDIDETKEEMFEIELEDGNTIKVTGNHQLYINGEYKKIIDVLDSEEELYLYVSEQTI